MGELGNVNKENDLVNYTAFLVKFNDCLEEAVRNHGNFKCIIYNTNFNTVKIKKILGKVGFKLVFEYKGNGYNNKVYSYMLDCNDLNEKIKNKIEKEYV